MSQNDETDPIGLDEAFALDGPEDNRRLYAAWADTYESDFMTSAGYVYHQRVAEVFSQGYATGPVLDVGCGTGVLGQELRGLGIAPIDGIDISVAMLTKASAKADSDGAVYRDLIEADLTSTIDIANNQYDGIVSSGAFTHGHLGPDSLLEVLRVARPGCHCAIGVNLAHFEELGFRSRLDLFQTQGLIGPYELVQRPIYSGGETDDPNSMANVMVFASR